MDFGFSSVAAKMEILATDMLVLVGKDPRWRIFLTPELMLLMAKLLVFLEYLMVN